MMWNHRMFLLTGDAKYIDALERTTFNGALSGVSLSGDRFFYPNPLVADGVTKFNQHFPGRAPWFGCACCPPNLMRTVASLTGYFYATRDRSLFVNFYGQSEGEATVAGTSVKLAQTTDYPWQGAVRLAVSPAKPAKFAIRLRVPGWAQGQPVPSDLYTYENPAPAAWSVRLNGKPVNAKLDAGYVAIDREWRSGDVVELDLPMTVHAVRGHPSITATKDRVAFERGPIVYCIEDPEMKTTPANFVVSVAAKIEAKPQPNLCGGVTVLTIPVTGSETPVTAIPYYAWNNRGVAAMAVWFQRAP
jgi:DUF1680 family protein